MQLVHLYNRIEIEDKFKLVSSNNVLNSASVDITYNFSNQDVPSDSEFTIYGLTRKTANRIQVGDIVNYYGGFTNSDHTQNNVAHVLSAKITSIKPLENDGGNLIFKFTVHDGADHSSDKEIKVATSELVRTRSTNKANNYRKQLGAYEKQQHSMRDQWLRQNKSATRHQKHERYVQMENNIKAYRTQLLGNANRENKKLASQRTRRTKIVYRAMSFKAGSTGGEIIQKLANKAGIKINQLKLMYNRVYLNGYTARKKPINCIRDIAKDCKTDMFYQHGKLVIKSFISNKRLGYTCNTITGLIKPPTKNDDEDDKNTYSMTILFNPRITTGSIFRVNDEFTGFKDNVIVTNGSATISSDSTPTMDITVKRLSVYTKQLSKEVAKAKSEDAKRKAKLDAKNVAAAKNKRTR